MQGGSASSGARRSGRIRRRRSSAAGEGENVGGGVPGLFWSRETTRRTREDLRSSGRRRGGEKGMVAAANGVGGDGCVRVRAREKEQRGGASRKSERGPRGLRGVAGGNQGRRRQPGREEVAGARGRARRARARPPGREEDDTGRWRWRAGPILLGHQVGGPQVSVRYVFSALSFTYCFLFFFCNFVALLKILNQSQKSCNCS